MADADGGQKKMSSEKHEQLKKILEYLEKPKTLRKPEDWGKTCENPEYLWTKQSEIVRLKIQRFEDLKILEK